MAPKKLHLFLFLMIGYLPLKAMEENKVPKGEELRAFCAIQTIHDIVEASLDAHPTWMRKGNRMLYTPLDPFSELCVTRGLFLNTRSSIPEALLTPWGCVLLVEGTFFLYNDKHKDSYKAINQELLQHIVVKEVGEKPDFIEHDYKVYRVLSVKGIHLPAAEMRYCPVDKGLSTVWKRLYAKYLSSKID